MRCNHKCCCAQDITWSARIVVLKCKQYRVVLLKACLVFLRLRRLPLVVLNHSH
eukprot:XP_001708998.1 Hypothetical protein GL50803_38906 [Giardia lamblia ATCC 50803]